MCVCNCTCLCAESEVRKRWKSLKKDYHEGLLEVETLISSLQERSDQLQERRDRLETLLLMLKQKVCNIYEMLVENNSEKLSSCNVSNNFLQAT